MDVHGGSDADRETYRFRWFKLIANKFWKSHKTKASQIKYSCSAQTSVCLLLQQIQGWDYTCLFALLRGQGFRSLVDHVMRVRGGRSEWPGWGYVGPIFEKPNPNKKEQTFVPGFGIRAWKVWDQVMGLVTGGGGLDPLLKTSSSNIR